ncbi:MAG: hypothetical protein MIO92_12750 [Methanosarcinaceae archaeon]|nr:hypothetical protein [Methanosarcinaceae archaeon]
MSSTDTGYIYFSPSIVDRDLQFKNGKSVIDYRKKGVVITENHESPLYDGTIELMGAITKDENGYTIKTFTLCEIMDFEGNLIWGANVSLPTDTTYEYDVKYGVLKWKHIHSKLILQPGQKRIDDFEKVPFIYTWELAPHIPLAEKIPPADAFPLSSKGYSLHDRHYTWERRKMAGGYDIDLSLQEGVYIVEGENMPAFNSRWYGRSWAVFEGSDGRQSDVMLSELIDVDGDMLFSWGFWWYADVDGVGELLGGTGKWETIAGVAYNSTSDAIGVTARQDHGYHCYYEIKYSL